MVHIHTRTRTLVLYHALRITTRHKGFSRSASISSTGGEPLGQSAFSENNLVTVQELRCTGKDPSVCVYIYYKFSKYVNAFEKKNKNTSSLELRSSCSVDDTHNEGRRETETQEQSASTPLASVWSN